MLASPAPSMPIHEPVLNSIQIYKGAMNGPALSREQELALIKLLDHVLVQVQTCVKALDQEPIGESDLVNDFNVSGSPATRPGDLNSARSVWFKYESEEQVAKTVEVNKKLVKLIDEFSSTVKSLIDAEMLQGGVSAEFAPQLLKRIELLSRNFQVAVKSAGDKSKFANLVAMLPIPDSVDNFLANLVGYSCKIQELATIADFVRDNLETTPGKYSGIGKKAYSLLTEDFCFTKMKLNSDPVEKMSFAIGSEDGGGFSTHQFLMKLKGGKHSLFISAKSVIAAAKSNAKSNGEANADNPNAEVNLNAENGLAPDPIIKIIQNAKIAKPVAKPVNVISVKYAVNDVYWKNLKLYTSVSLSFLAWKGSFRYIEMRYDQPYYSCAFDVGLYRSPIMNLSALMGVKSGCIGFQYTHDYGKSANSFGVGVRFTNGLADYGLNFKEPGTYRASICKKLMDSATIVAGILSYSPVEGDKKGVRLTLGLKHTVDPSFYLKARAGSAGVSVAVKKSFFDGKCTVKAASHVDIKDPWRRPKMGIVFSYRS